MRTDVAIIGSGIVGLSCAFHLHRAGHDCLLIDPHGFGNGASFGNAGAISFGNIFPQATPGVAWQGLRMLLNPDAPLKLDWASWPAWLGWLMRFVRAGDAARMEPAITALHALNRDSRSAWLELADAIDARELLAETGYLHVYSEAANFAADAWKRVWFDRLGIHYRSLGARELRELEPGIGEGFAHGVLQEDSLALRDPGGFCQRLGNFLLADGARSLRADATRIERESDQYRVHTDQGVVQAERVVLAAGAHSNELLRVLGVKLPVIAARGYHLMYPPQEGLLQRPTLWIERHIVLSPMRSGMRLAGLKELTRPDRPARYGFIRRRQADAHRLCPALTGEVVREWHGDRPVSPDSLPIISRLADENFFLAMGHGHLGMTQGPITGKLIAALVTGKQASIPLHPYRHTRFG